MQYELTIGGQTKRSTLGQHPVTIDWDALPEPARDFAIRYGLRQYLSDAMAGATDEADAKAKVEARVAKLRSGDLSRAKGEGLGKPDTEQTRAGKLARAAIRTALKTQNKTASKEDIEAAATKLVASNPKFLADAKKQLEAEKAMAAGTELNLADLGIDLG